MLIVAVALVGHHLFPWLHSCHRTGLLLRWPDDRLDGVWNAGRQVDKIIWNPSIIQSFVPPLCSMFLLPELVAKRCFSSRSSSKSFAELPPLWLPRGGCSLCFGGCFRPLTYTRCRFNVSVKARGSASRTRASSSSPSSSVWSWSVRATEGWPP